MNFYNFLIAIISIICLTLIVICYIASKQDKK